jgi:hypothetical protein
MSNFEKQAPNTERNPETIDASAEHYERARNKSESVTESQLESAESHAETARARALEGAVSVEKSGTEKTPKPSHQSPRRGPISKKERNKSYRQTMKNVQDELPIASRTFSKVIHNRAIEKTSDAIGGSIARPNAILSGAVCAFALTLLLYITAKTMGYRLSGSESMTAFFIGWVIGIIYDYLRVLITGKKY